jgi:serine/threonine protein kinase
VKCLNAQSVVIKGVRVTFDGTIASSAQRAVGNHVSCYCAEKTDLFSTDPMNPCFGKPACPQNFVVTCASNEVLKGQYAADVNQYFEKMFQPCLMANGGSAVAAKRTCHEDDRLGTQVCAWYSDQPPGLQCQPKLATLSLWAGLRRCYMAVRSDECVSPDRRRWLCGTGLQSTVKLKCPQQFPGCTIRATTEYTTDASMQMIAHTGYECSWNESSAAAKTVLAKISSAAFASKNTGYFRVDCVGKWSTFGSCSKTCGGGLKSQTFHVTTAAAHGGKSCKYSDGQAGRDVRCNMQPCPVHCVGAWGLTKCSRKCGGGIRHRMFQVVTPASGGGRPCINATGAIDTSNVQMCNTHPCPVDCVGKWSTFGSCSKTCGGGVKSQTFHVTTAAAHGGKSCQYSDGQAGRDVRCNMQPCPVHCVGAWGLTKCSRKCGGGIRHRMFQVVTPASGGGRPCSHASGDTDKPSPCNTHPCPVNCVGAWGDYGDCSTTCGGGTQEKVYTVSITAAHGGADCVAADDETHERSCGNDACSATPEIEESSSVVLAAGLAAVFALCAGLIIRSKCVHSQQVGSAFDKTDGIENPVSRDADFDSRHAEFSESHITDVVTMELRGCSVTLLKDNVIGEGANGIVIAAVLTRQGGKQENVAAKSLPSGATDRDREKFQKEFEILAQAAKACRGACRVYGLLKRDNAMYIIMKRYPQSLLDLLEKERIDDTKRAPLSFNTYMQIGIGVAHALTELHAIDIRVMDLKPANVLLDQDSVPVISDFGIAAVCGETLTHGTTAAAGATAGTPQYKAPEQWNTKLGKVGTKCDIWAWGCIMVEMLSGIEPWQDHDTIQILSAIVVDKESPKIPKGVPPPLNKLLQQCFQFDCEDRPSATGLVNLLERLLAAMVKTDSSQLGLLADAMLRSSWAKREVYEYSRLISADECSDPKLVARYEEYKAKLESEGANPQDIEKLLFHGCAENAVTNISRQGLRKERQRSASGSQWQRFGAAFYFGVQSSKSHEYPLEDMRNLPPGTHTRSMLLCKVATGKVYETKENKPDLEAAPPGYHSVYGFADASGPLNYDEVVVYDEAAIQPYVVVHYEFVKHPPVPLSSIASSDEESEPEFLLDVINDIVLEEDEEDPDLE